MMEYNHYLRRPDLFENLPFGMSFQTGLSSMSNKGIWMAAIIHVRFQLREVPVLIISNKLTNLQTFINKVRRIQIFIYKRRILHPLVVPRTYSVTIANYPVMTLFNKISML